MKSLSPIFVGFFLSSAVQATGLHSDELRFECSGQLIVESVHRVDEFPEWFDRAGNLRPARAYAYLNMGIESQGAGCDLMEQKLEIDLDSKHLQSYVKLNLHSAISLENQAALKVGEIYGFSSHQNIGFSDNQGYLPFFPLIHHESVSLLAEGIRLTNASYAVDGKKVYDINLNEQEKRQLSRLVFSYLELDDKKGLFMGGVVREMLKNYPTFRNDFYIFASRVLKLYTELEAHHVANSLSVDSVMTAVSSAIREYSYNRRWQTVLDVSELLVHHPSLYNYNSVYADSNKCLSLTAIQLEQSLSLLGTKLQSDELLPNVKTNWKAPLKVIAGHLYSSTMTPCLKPITSSLSRETAKELLKNHYN